MSQPKQIPQHYIGSRTEHIAELKRNIERFGVVEREFYLGKTEAEIRECEDEIRYANHRLSLGKTEPY